jgi:hypothetical protein
MMSNGVDFNDQFDFRNTRAPYLLDQRQRFTLAAMYEPFHGKSFEQRWTRALVSHWTLSSVLLFSSGRPYAALLDVPNNLTGTALQVARKFARALDVADAGGSFTINDTAALQSTANSALGINGSGPSPVTGLNSFYGPGTRQVDLGIARKFAFKEHYALNLEAQAFNLFNHPNYYVQNGNGVDAVQYTPVGDQCGDGQTLRQTCYLVPHAGFGTLQVTSPINGPRVLQFAVELSF